MSIVLPALGVAFAAVCVWLGVRIINRRERWAKWTLASTLALPVLYVASFGPACWIVTGTGREQNDIFDRVFWPIGWCTAIGPDFASDFVRWYAMLGSPRGSKIYLPDDSTLDHGWAIDE